MVLAVTGVTGQIGGRSQLVWRRSAATANCAGSLAGAQPAGGEIHQVSSYGDPAAMGQALSGVDTCFDLARK